MIFIRCEHALRMHTSSAWGCENINFYRAYMLNLFDVAYIGSKGSFEVQLA